MRPAVLFPRPLTAELSRLLILAIPLMDFQSQQRPKPLSGLLEQNAFHTDAVALGSVISTCCCLRPLNFISGCTANVSTCWHVHNEREWQNAPNFGPDMISSLSLPEKDPDGPSQHGLASNKLVSSFNFISYAAKSCFFYCELAAGFTYCVWF